MRRFLKVFLINTILLISFIFNFQNNISYCQNKSNVDELLYVTNKEEKLHKVIRDFQYILENEKERTDNIHLYAKRMSINKLKFNQINLISLNLNNELNKCIRSKYALLEKVRIDKQLEAEKTSSSYVKGIWPVKNYYYISSNYGYRIHPITKKYTFHSGIDIPAPENTPVLSSDDGIVIFAGYKKGYGNVVEIKHFDSKKTLYAHNNSIEVKVGDIVKKGQIISRVGSTGNSTGNHVHFEIKINNKTINPIDGVNKDTYKIAKT